jgi:hypothetical protein
MPGLTRVETELCFRRGRVRSTCSKTRGSTLWAFLIHILKGMAELVRAPLRVQYVEIQLLSKNWCFLRPQDLLFAWSSSMKSAASLFQVPSNWYKMVEVTLSSEQSRRRALEYSPSPLSLRISQLPNNCKTLNGLDTTPPLPDQQVVGCLLLPQWPQSLYPALLQNAMLLQFR